MQIFFVILSFLCCVAMVAAKAVPPTQTKVTALPGLDGPLSSAQFTGYINVNTTVDAYLFYWFAESQSNPSSDPVVLWMTGGPGCSSELAYFRENGPYHMNPDQTLTANPYSWNKRANVIWIDQPVGTGFSYLGKPLSDGYVHGEKEMANEMYVFLQQWFQLYPSYKGREFFIFGESYAGHYVPSLADRINIGNNNSANIFIQLAGIGVGNGMTAPEYFYSSYGPYAYGHAMIDYATLQKTEKQYDLCEKALSSGNYNTENVECNTIIQMIQSQAGPFNTYDVTKTCPPGLPLCYNFTATQDYLNQPAVQKALGATGKWELCSTIVHLEIAQDWFSNQQTLVPSLLANNQRVMVYNGINDFIVNFMGSEAWVREMEWPYQSQYVNAPRSVWMVNQEIAGYSLSYGPPGGSNLTMLTVLNAGHMVPMDQPRNALMMLENFINKVPFGTQTFSN